MLREGVHVLGPEIRRPFFALIAEVATSDLERGFLIANVVVVTFGAWCAIWPIRHAWASAPLLAWLWVTIETINGIGHPLWSLAQGGYTPGVVTAPLLFVLAMVVARRLRAS